MTKGIPDTLTFYTYSRGGRTVVGRLWIEFKRPGTGRISAAQKAMVELLISLGEDAIFCYSEAEAINELMIRLRYGPPGLVNQKEN